MGALHRSRKWLVDLPLKKDTRVFETQYSVIDSSLIVGSVLWIILRGRGVLGHGLREERGKGATPWQVEEVCERKQEAGANLSPAIRTQRSARPFTVEAQITTATPC